MKKCLDLSVPKHFSEAYHAERDLDFIVVDHIPTHRKVGDRLLF